VNSLWVEKYRPQTLDDLVLPNEYKVKFKEYFKTKDVPSLLLHGPPGTGKSSIARILTSKNGIISDRKSNVLVLNGSSKSTRGIDFVSKVIEPYLKNPVTGQDKLKIVFIDEADYLTDQAAHALRAIIEKYSEFNRFVFTCNYVSKIPDALQSRLTEYKFQLLPKNFIIDLCENILKEENVSYEIGDVEYIVSFMYPDVRKIIDRLQKFSVEGKLTIDKNSVITYENMLISKFIEIMQNTLQKKNSVNSKLIQDVIELLNKHAYEIDYRKVFEDLFNRETLPPYIKIKVNQYSVTHKTSLSPSMNFMSLIFESIETVKHYMNLIGVK
jgi:DNA polymerase III delta prime subunit